MALSFVDQEKAFDTVPRNMAIQFNSIIYSHNTVQLHSMHVSVTKYNVDPSIINKKLKLKTQYISR